MFENEDIMALEQELIDTYLKSSFHPVKILLKIHKRYIKELLLSLFFYTIKTLPCIFLPVITAKLINLVVTPTEHLAQTMSLYIVLMVVLFLINIPMQRLYIKYYSIVSRMIEAGLRGALVRKLQQLSISFHKEMQSGRIQSKLIRDVETIQSLSDNLFSTLPGIVINAVTALVIVLHNNLTVFWFFLLCIPCSVITVKAFLKPIDKTNKKFRKEMEHTSANITDMIEMTPITRAHALEEMEIRKITSNLSLLANTGFRRDMIHALFGSVSWVLFQLFQFVCLVFSTILAIRGEIGVGDITLYQSYFTTLTGQVSTIISLMPVISKGFDSIGSVGEILCSMEVEDNREKTPLPTLRGEYEFKNVCFSYQNNQPLLQGIDLKVNAGETIAFVGESGSGKTTLMNLLVGFYLPQSGTLTVDGHDITTLNLNSYRQHLSIVPQNVVLFTGTIRDNITYGMTDVSDKQLHAALDAARLTDLIDSLPLGADTPLEEHGANLSGGQRQRLSIARALIRDPDVILLDEATSALDSVSEKQIQEAINNLTKERTTFIVAHRLATIKNADRIAVIKDGRCVEIGSYDELMAKKGEFYALRSLQQV
ncbi:MAG: ABC transporter ATP-binding protein [Clostridia bacterium]|nr:ABC transporter ATP-binding protein [Clostridia bacterium]